VEIAMGGGERPGAGATVVGVEGEVKSHRFLL
jgi:hypothetical protein